MRYLLLMRHADHEPVIGDRGGKRRLTRDGATTVAAVGGRLAESLDEPRLSGSPHAPGQPIRIGTIRHSERDEARATAEVVAQSLPGEIAVRPDPDLSPEHLEKFVGAEERGRLVENLLAEAAAGHQGPDPPNAALVVGHQPMLGWLAHVLTGRAWPMARSEVLCIEVAGSGRRGRLRWVVSPLDREAVDQLREKIKSKMDVAKLLSAFITAALGFLLGALIDATKVERLDERLWAVYVSAGLLFAAIALYLATMYAYDTLLMPHRFWEESPSGMRKRPAWIVARPPSSVQWILYQNMIRIWNSLFTPATIAVLGALGFLAYAVVAANVAWPHVDRLFLVLALAFLAATVLGYRGAFRRSTGPWVGSED